MRITEITEIMTTETAAPVETWETRFAKTQRNQAKCATLRAKLTTAQSAAARQRRAAADKQASANDRIRSIQSDLAQPPTAA